MAGGHDQAKIIQLFLCCMAAIYFFAFTSIYRQIPGLYGENGLYPATYVLEDKSICEDTDENCPKWAKAGHCTINSWMTTNCAKSCNTCKVGFWKFMDFPTILWLAPYLGLTTGTGMELTCIIAIPTCLTMVISPGARDCIAFAVVWFLYYSLVQVGQVFLYYQWDSLLLEAGFLTILIAPWNLFVGVWNIFKCRRFRSFGRCHDGVTFWLVKWLLFRLMFASGIVKLLWQDESWWSLTALNWHYESQCIPSPFAWYMQKLPNAFRRFSTVMTYLIEIGVPVLFFAPFRALRTFAFFCQILLQGLIIFTGNYNFFNFLTIALCLSLLDDESCHCVISSCCRRRKVKQETKVSAVPCDGDVDIRSDDLDISSPTKADLERQEEEQCAKEMFQFDKSASTILKDHLYACAESKLPPKRLAALRTVGSDRKTTVSLKVMKWAMVIATVSILLGFTAKWSGMVFSKTDFIRVELTFSYNDFVVTVKKFLIWSMGIGLLSLSIEIVAALMRSGLGCNNLVLKLFCVGRTIIFALVALWMFGLSLVPYTDWDREARAMLPKFLINQYYDTEKYKLVDSYGLFRSMTGIGGRPEIIIMGGEELTENSTWTEYNFKYKPGNLYQAPPINVPHQPRLDWQMWFAALEDYSSNLWYIHLCYKLLKGERDVLQLLGHNDKLATKPPRYIRSVLYRYHYTLNSSSLMAAIWNKGKERKWWTREYIGEYMPVVEKGDKGLQYLLRKFGLIRNKRTVEKHQGILYSFVLMVRSLASSVRTEVLILVLFLKCMAVKLAKDWWEEKGSKKRHDKMVGLERESRRVINKYTQGIENAMRKLPKVHIKSKKKDKWT